MRLLLDEMYPGVVAEHLRGRGHDVVSVHDADYRQLEGVPDEEIFAVALAEDRVLVTENVADFVRLEMQAHGRGEVAPIFIFTTNRQFPRGEPGTTGRLVEAFDRHLTEQTSEPRSIFLKRPFSAAGSGRTWD